MNEDEGQKLLSRLDERTLNISVALKKLSEDISSKYVTKEEFGPVKSIVYGMVGFILITFISGFVTLIVRRG